MGATVEMPATPGLWLYSITKAIGHEISRVFSMNHAIYVLRCVVSGFFDGSPPDGSTAGMWQGLPFHF